MGLNYVLYVIVVGVIDTVFFEVVEGINRIVDVRDKEIFDNVKDFVSSNVA